MTYSLSPSRTRHASLHHKNTANKITTSDLAQPSAQPWTATRCHRLLRPLLTHLSSLRKDKTRRSLAAQEDANANIAKRRRDASDSACYRPEKRPCRKYSGRASRNVDWEDATPQKPSQSSRRRRVQCTKPASSRQEVVLPTPFLRRVKNHALSSPPNRSQMDDHTSEEEPRTTSTGSGTRCAHQQTCSKGKCAFEAELAQLKASTDSARHGLYKSIFRAFDALLRSTSASKYPSAAAPKSFLAMCLRKVPDYVAELDYWDQKDAQEQGIKSDKQISFEVYTELEGFNGVSDGWRHLCAVVRAHGVRIIRDAILEEQLFEDAFTDLLLRLALEYMPLMDCVGMIDAYTQRPYPRAMTADDSLFTTEGLHPLRILKICDERAAPGASFLATKLAELLSMELLPAKWILTKEFKALWVSTAGSVVKRQYRKDVVDFITTTLSNMCTLVSNSERLAGRMKEDEQPWDKAQNTLVGAIAALTSITLLLQDGASSTERTELVGNRIKFIVDSCLRGQEPIHIGAYLLNLCAYLIFKTEPSLLRVQSAWERLRKDKGHEEWTRQCDATAVFVSSVAYYCSRGAHLSPTESLARLCDELDKLHLPGNPFDNLRMDAAFSLADQTGDLRDLAFAEDLKAKMKKTMATTGQRHNASKAKQQRVAAGASNPDETPLAGGFRWDEGISEWVNVSPVPVPPRRRTRRAARRLCDRRVPQTAPPRGGRQTRNKAPDYREVHDETDEEDEAPGTCRGESLAEEMVSDGGDVTNQGEESEELEEEEEEEEEIHETLVNQPEYQESIPDSDEDSDFVEDEEEMASAEGAEGELETSLPALANLFSSNRLRRPRRSTSQPQQLKVPSSPPSSLSASSYSESLKRHSIWSANSTTTTTLDDELCLDSPSPTRSQRHKETKNRLSGDSIGSGTISKIRKVGSSRTSLLSLQPRRKTSGAKSTTAGASSSSCSSSSSNIAVVLQSSSSTGTIASGKKKGRRGRPRSSLPEMKRGETTAAAAAAATSTSKMGNRGRGGRVWDLGDESSDADELSFC